MTLFECLFSEGLWFGILLGAVCSKTYVCLLKLSCDLTSWSLALKVKPKCGKYHLQKGIVLWEMPSNDKLEAYGTFLEVLLYVVGQ